MSWAQALDRGRAVVARVGAAWRTLTPEQRLAAVAALLLLASMLLPWYQETGNAIVNGKLVRIEDSKNAFGVYSFIEGAIFLVVLGVVVLLFARGERRSFHLPGGDGTVIMGAGLWVMFLIFFRQLDKPNGRHEGLIQTSIGVQWGIFIAFLLGALLAYAGYRIRAAGTAEPDEEPTIRAERTAPAERPRTAAGSRRSPSTPEDGEQVSFDEPPKLPPPSRG